MAEKKIMIEKFDKKVDRNIFNKGYFTFSPTKINKMNFYFEIVHPPFYIQATEIKFFKVSHSYKSYSYNLVSSGILLKIKSTDEFKVEDINIKDIFHATSKTYYKGDFLYIYIPYSSKSEFYILLVKLNIYPCLMRY